MTRIVSGTVPRSERDDTDAMKYLILLSSLTPDLTAEERRILKVAQWMGFATKTISIDRESTRPWPSLAKPDVPGCYPPIRHTKGCGRCIGLAEPAPIWWTPQIARKCGRSVSWPNASGEHSRRSSRRRPFGLSGRAVSQWVS